MGGVGKATIYKIINLTNAKFYVGSTIDWNARIRTHRRKLRAGTHHCVPLQNSWNRYGEDAFVFRVVAEVDDFLDLREVEQVFLDEHHGSAQCYNLARYTDNATRGVPCSAARREKISEALKLYYADNLHPMLGVARSAETRALIGAKRAGKIVSEETKAKLRAANLGKVYSEETRAKLSAIRKGRERSEDHAAQYNKAVVEVTTGEVFSSLKAVKERFSMSPGSLSTALSSDKPLTKGKNAGRHFRYA